MLLTKHPFVAPDPPDENHENFLKRRLQDVCLDQGIFVDVIFELDDGACAAHKALLAARCDVMKAMFSGDFRESQAKVVSKWVSCEYNNGSQSFSFKLYMKKIMNSIPGRPGRFA